MIELHVEPRVTKRWEQFIQEAQPCSIALDGYVSGPPRYERKGPYLNLNHHEGVDRLVTSSTSSQVHIYVKQGLFRKFQKEGFPYAHVWINDPDQDTSLAVWLLRNHERFSGQRSEPLLNRIMYAEDMLDRTAGAYPFSTETDLMRDIAWVFEPFTTMIQQLPRLDARMMEMVVDSIGTRIHAYILGKGDKVIPDTRYEILHQATGWVMIREIGNYARTGLFNAGNYAFVSVRDGVEKQNHRYSLGKMSPFVEFPLLEIYEELNRREGIPADAEDRWGGSNTIGGSPRQAGSPINPGQLVAIIEEFLSSI